MDAPEPRKAIALVLVALLVGCARNPAPEGWRPPAAKAQRATRGGWILIELQDDSSVTGELIAVDETTFHVLTDSGFQSIPRPAAREARVVGYGAAENLWVWTIVGAISTLSHGDFLLLTLPLWLVGGSVANSREVKAAFVPPDDFAHFARFPQGLPPGFEAASLGPLAQQAVGPDVDAPPP